MKIKAKLFLGFGIVLALLVLVGVSGWYGIGSMQDSMAALKVQEGIEDNTSHVRDAINNATIKELRMLYYTNGEKKKGHYESIAAEFEAVNKDIEAAKKAMKNSKNQENAGKLLTASKEFKKLIDKWWGIQLKVASAGAIRKAAYDNFGVQIDKMIAVADKANKEAAKTNEGNVPEAMLDRYKIYRDLRDTNRKIAMEAYLYMRSNDPPVRKKHGENWVAGLVRAQEQFDVVKDAKGVLPEVKKSVESAEESLKTYFGELEKYLGHNDDQDACVAEMRKAAENADKHVKEVLKGVATAVKAADEDAVEKAHIIEAVILVVSIIAIVIGMVIALLLIRAIIRPVMAVVSGAQQAALGDLNIQLKEGSDEMGIMGEKLNVMLAGLRARSEMAEKIANGDLRVNVNVLSEKDTLGKAFETMVAQLNEVLAEVQMAVTQVNSGSTQVSDASQSLSQGATEQAASLEEITSAITETGTQTKRNAETASEANGLAGQAATAANAGQQRMEKMSASMEKINANAEETQKVIKTIDDIAFQTNLLALNAAVEAARAGQHGKGFAVVAEEVRNLAARSAKAAGETAELIEGSNKEIQQGVEIAGQTGSALNEIAEHVKETTKLVGEIATDSSEQALAITQVNESLQQIDTITQENTANAEETASAAEEMSSQAATLNQLIGRFQLKSGSASTTTTPSIGAVSEPMSFERESDFGKF